jgi:hypothetical protein
MTFRRCGRCFVLFFVASGASCATGPRPRLVRAYPYGVVYGQVRPPPDEWERATFATIAIVTPPQDLQVAVRLQFEADETEWGQDGRRSSRTPSLGETLDACRPRNMQFFCFFFAPIVFGVHLVATAAIAAAEHAATSTASSHTSATGEGRDEPLQGPKPVGLQDRLRDRVLRRASAETTHRFLPVPSAAARPKDADDYQELGNVGIDTVLEVKLSQVRLIAIAGEDPTPLGFFMRAEIRLVQPSSVTALYRTDVEYRGAPRSLSEWTADEHRLLVEEELRGCDSLADKIFDEVFLLYAP